VDERERRFAEAVDRLQARTGAIGADRPSRRQLQVGYLSVAVGLRYDQVGTLLGISTRTAEEHMARLAARLGLAPFEARRRLLLELGRGEEE